MNMQCEQARQLVERYADDQLDLERSLELEQHLETCAACAIALDNARQLGKLVRNSGIYGEVPANLNSRVRAAVISEAGIKPAPRAIKPVAWWRPLGIAVAAILILSVFVWRWAPGTPIRSEQNTLLAQEILDSHVRSLMADHLFDVPSTDQHTVKPWFDGKLDFSPPVIDLTPDGFELIGGRLDYIGGRPVATVVYKRRKHVINLSMWPENAVSPLHSTMRNGYNLLHWQNGGLEYWAVSDLNPQELQEFAGLIQNKAPSASK
jgi:anti-sigma factor RsiW